MSAPRRLAAVLLAGAALLPAATQAAGAGLGAELDWTSNYLWRGISLSRHEPALQGAATVSSRDGYGIGAWMSTVEFRTPPGGPDAPELQQVFQAWARRPLPGQWSTAARLSWVAFPGAEAPGTSGFPELELALDWAGRLVLSGFVADGTYGYLSGSPVRRGRVVGASLAGVLPLPARFGLTWDAGWVDAEGAADVAWGHWSVGIARRFGPLEIHVGRASTWHRPFAAFGSAVARSETAVTVRLGFATAD
jgi:uncharacterized protein (TIGR02001 family)